MPFTSICPYCQHQVLTANPLPVGRLVKCPSCKKLYPAGAPATAQAGSPSPAPNAANASLAAAPVAPDVAPEAGPRFEKSDDDELGNPSCAQQIVARLVGAFVVGIFACFLLYHSLNIFRTGSYDMIWSSESTLGGEEQEIERYRGLSAYRMGVGYGAAGCVLGTWAFALVWTVFFPGPAERKDFTRPEWGLTILSLSFLTIAMPMFFPPWSFTASAIGFWLALAAIALATVVIRLPALEAYRKYVAIAVIGPGILLFFLFTGIGFGFLFGLMVGFIGVIHGLILMPSVRADLMGSISGAAVGPQQPAAAATGPRNLPPQHLAQAALGWVGQLNFGKALAGAVFGFLLAFMVSGIAWNAWNIDSGATSEPLAVDLAKLEKGAAPGNDHIKIGAHTACYFATIFQYSTTTKERHKRPDPGTWIRHSYYPIISGAHPYWIERRKLQAKYGKLENVPDGVPLPELSDFRVLVRTDRFRTVGDIPPEDLRNDKSVQGQVINKFTTLDAGERQLIQEDFPNVNFDKVLILDESRQPSSGFFYFGLVCFCLLLWLAWFGGVGLWIYSRVRQRGAFDTA